MKSPTEMAATVVLKIGPIKATFNGEVTLKNLKPPHSYTIQGEGKGGIAGFAKGGADVTLTADGPDATVLKYAAKADVGGKIAQLGSRLIEFDLEEAGRAVFLELWREGGRLSRGRLTRTRCSAPRLPPRRVPH